MFIENKITKSTDEELMRLVQKNKSQAYEELYKRYIKKIYWYFYKMLNKNEILAEELSQECMIRIYTKANTFDCEKIFGKWIFTIAHNLCIAQYRLKKYYMESIDDIETEGDYIVDNNFDFKIDMKIKSEVLAILIEELEPIAKSIILMRFFYDYSFAEIAEILNKPVGTIKSKLFYILKNLSIKLIEYKD